jgi:hypothetical protein
VITATLAVMGAQAVIATFVIANRRSLVAFYAVSAAGLVLLMTSLVLGATGINEIANVEHEGPMEDEDQ